MKSLYTVLFFLLCFLALNVHAQNIKLYASPRGNADVLDVNGDTMLNPWCGGWLTPQFSSIDLNGDGLLDLFVFQCNIIGDSRILTFLNTGNGKYQYAPDYESFFPFLQYWALLVDYNKDGKPDIFSYADVGSGIDVYKNVSDSNGIKFTKITPYLQRLDYTDDANHRVNIYSTQITLPAIADIDGDGDIDIVSFDPSYFGASYFKNNAVEKGESLDSLDFTNPTQCWGDFHTTFSSYPSVDSTLTIHCRCGPSGCGASMSQETHGASTMLLVDMENKGDKDMLYGNQFNNFVVQMTNGRTKYGSKNDTIVAVDSAFIGDNHKVNVAMFPSAYLADGTADNVPDLITAPFIDTNTVADHKTFLYRNTGQTTGNHYEFVEDNFMQNTMLDYGEHAAPVFVDYNHDSLMDLVIATRANPTGGYYNPIYPNHRHYDHLELYKNIGTKNKAVYEKVDDDFGSLKKYGLTFLAPTFADLDGDGRPDMFVGSASGKVMYFKNVKDSGNTISMKLISDSLPNIQASKYSTPCLAHVSNDSLCDLVMGCDTGTFSYYKNVGNKSAPNFKLITSYFGKVRTNMYYYGNYVYDSNGNIIDSSLVKEYSGRSAPLITDLDHNGKPDLISGSNDENMFMYFNITDNLSGSFTRTDTVFYNTLKHVKENKNLGMQTMPAAADLDNDGYPELLIGNYSGGIQYFGSKIVKLTKLHNSFIQPPVEFSSLFSLYPNPARDNVILQYYNSLEPEDASVTVTDMMGKTITNTRFIMLPGTGKQQIATTGLASGVYFVSITTPDRFYSGGKLIISR